METGTEREFLSPDGLAAYLHVPVATVYQWNHNGTGPRHARIGKHVRYRRADVEQWLASRTSEPREGV